MEKTVSVFKLSDGEIINMTPADIVILPEGGGKFVIPRSGFEVGLDDEFYKPSPAECDVPLVHIQNKKSNPAKLKIFRAADTPKTTPFPDNLQYKFVIVDKEFYSLSGIKCYFLIIPLTNVYDEQGRIIGYRSLGYIV